MNLDLMQELEPDGDMDEADFEFPVPLPQWDKNGIAVAVAVVADSSTNQKEDGECDRSWNRYGAVYVRLLRAQRLPCPVGSSVVGAVSLPPFAGRVKTCRKSAFLSSETHGVCVRWDNDDHTNIGTNKRDGGLLKMVSQGNYDSPVPFIQISLLFSPLGMGILDFTMCDLSLPCHVLMKSPGVWKKAQWCQASLSDGTAATTTTANNTNPTTTGRETNHTAKQPLILVEAMFQPLGDSNPAHTTVLSPGMGRPTKKVEMALPPLLGTPPRRRRPRDDPSSPPRSSSVAALSNTSGAASSVQESWTNGEAASTSNNTSIMEAPTNPHMLRVASFWVPSACSVCSKMLIGNKKGFHCEACSIICCVDCRLTVDLEIPCGSDRARSKVENSMQNKLSVQNILSIVAPDESFAEKNRDQTKKNQPHHPLLLSTSTTTSMSLVHGPEDEPTSGSTLISQSTTHAADRDPPAPHSPAGIGCLRIEFVRARLWEQALSPDESPDTAFGTTRPTREGEYYARITTSTQKNARTRPVYSGTPQFNSQLIELLVSHYGEEFRLDCVDSRTGDVVGTALLSTQGILQDQRDEAIRRDGVVSSLFQCFRGPLVEKGLVTKRIMLRTGVREAFGLEFYLPSKELTSESEKGAISGWLEINLGLEEFVDHLYHSQKPFKCPARPPDDFNTTILQLHIMRARIIWEEFNALLELYTYAVSWRDPLLTGSSFVLLVWLCLCFNSEYMGSLPAFALLCSSIYCCVSQSRKGRKEPFIRREVEASRQAAKISVDYCIHRPVGTISVSVPRGRALVSPDLGIPGRTCCRIFYDPLRFASDKSRSKVIEYDKAAESLHEVGSTVGILSADPEWSDGHQPSVENMRLQQLFRHADDFFEDEPNKGMSPLLGFPVLQPFEMKGRRRDTSGRLLDGALKGWETSTGAVILQIRLAIGFDQVLGEVVVPLSQLVAKGEIKGWFQVLDPGTKSLAPIQQHENGGTEIDIPRIQIALKWNPPDKTKLHDETQRETSVAVQEELVRSSRLSKQVHFDLVGSSIDAVNTALGLGNNIQSIQNTLGAVLDSIEGAHNAFNFTDPFKSSLLFVAISVLSIALVVIPTRYIVLLGVLGQFGSTFVERYGAAIYESIAFFTHFPKEKNQGGGESNKRPSGIDERDPLFLEKWFTNALRSLPTNEDLRRAYFWESRRLSSYEKEKFASAKRVSRLDRLWKARWHSTVEILTNDDDGSPHWKPAFAVIEGRRFLLWESVMAFDSGALATGHVVFAGHAGMTSPSPVEVRGTLEEVRHRVGSIFGRGSGGQQTRMTMILPDAATKTTLEAAVSETVLKDE